MGTITCPEVRSDFAPKRPTKRSAGGYVKGKSGRSKVHGLTGSPIFKVWDAMMYRCYVDTCHAWKDYGGRGIRVCERWHSFPAFAKDMGSRPDGMTLDRWPNPNGNYEPSNCRWATMQEQNNNKRNRILLTVRGQTHSVQEWASIVGLTPHRIRRRLKRGWTPEDSILRPRRRS